MLVRCDFRAIRIALLVWWACAPAALCLAEDSSAARLTLTHQADDFPHFEVEQARQTGPWHIEIGFRDSCTKLAETKRMLDVRLDRPMRLDVLDFFDKPETPIDRKSDFLLTTLYLGVGRQESDWLIWTVYVGGGMGRDSDHQRKANVNLEVSFKYAYAYTGLTAEIYPWKVPTRRPVESWDQVFRASRPFLATGFETGYVSAEGRGHWKIAPFPRLYQDKVLIRDWITSVNFGLGWHIPVSTRWSFILMGDYRVHFYRPDEYNGWTLTTALRYNLR